jgi:RING-like zinc finger
MLLCDVCLLNQGGRIRRSTFFMRHRGTQQQQEQEEDQHPNDNVTHGSNERSTHDIENQHRQYAHRFLKQLLPCRILTVEDLEKWAAAATEHDATMSSSSVENSSACNGGEDGNHRNADVANEEEVESAARRDHHCITTRNVTLYRSSQIHVDSSSSSGKGESCKEQQLEEDAATKNSGRNSSHVSSKNNDNDHHHHDDDHTSTGNNGSVLCSICLGELTLGDEIVQAQPCQHVFHSDCILQWVITCTTTTYSSVGRSPSSSPPSVSYWNLARDASAGGRGRLAISRTDCPNCRTEIVSPTALEHAIVQQTEARAIRTSSRSRRNGTSNNDD